MSKENRSQDQSNKVKSEKYESEMIDILEELKNDSNIITVDLSFCVHYRNRFLKGHITFMQRPWTVRNG